MEVYHGSSVPNLKTIKPLHNQSGSYVYATNDKTLAIIMSHAYGSEFTYNFERKREDKPYELVERLPGSFDIMYKNKAYIYTLDGEDFTYIDPDLNEQLVSIKEEEVINEEKIGDLYQKIESLEKDGLIKIYKYPDKPEGFKRDNSDLIDKIANLTDMDKMISKFGLLLSYYPELLDKVNNKIFSIDDSFEGFDTKSLFAIIENCIDRYNIDPESEPFLKLKLDKFTKLYPIYFKNIDLVNILKKNQDKHL